MTQLVQVALNEAEAMLVCDAVNLLIAIVDNNNVQWAIDETVRGTLVWNNNETKINLLKKLNNIAEWGMSL